MLKKYVTLLFHFLAGYARDDLKSYDDVSDWLAAIGTEYKAYGPMFKNKMVDGFWLLNYVNKATLTQYGVKDKNHQQEILQSIENIREECARQRSAK
jgi:hypothetical protein